MGKITKTEYFAKIRDMISSNEYSENQAAESIRQAIQILFAYNLCTLEEFLSLVDLDYKEYWHFISDEIAKKAETLIRRGKLHPNQIKPWQICKDYRIRFEKISVIKEWRELHGALNAIIESITDRSQVQ